MKRENNKEFKMDLLKENSDVKVKKMWIKGKAMEYWHSEALQINNKTKGKVCCKEWKRKLE